MPATVLRLLSFPDFIQMAQNFDECRRKWLRAEQDLGSCKEVLTKAETERGALEVKLKHARNQVDVEIRRRQKAEADCEKLVRWIKCLTFLLRCVDFVYCHFTQFTEFLICALLAFL